MDSELLATMVEHIHQQAVNIHSLLVIRNGYLVMEVYFYPFQPGVRHWMASCTKSVTSALIGIAIDQGHIKSIDQPFLQFFSDRVIASSDSRKKSITLEHLLTMTSGLLAVEPPIPNAGKPALLSPLFPGDDWVQYSLDKPVVADPGATWEYNSAGSHLLSAIVQASSGASTPEFAQKHLFEPLGITDVYWPTDPAGTAVGGWGLQLRPHDMAKLGYLYLNRGVWEGRQIVPTEWIAASTQSHVDVSSQGRTGYNGYGYQWWITPSGDYATRGYGGQRIYVSPDQSLIIVSTGNVSLQYPDSLFRDFVIPAVKSSSPLPDAPQSLARLASLIKAVGQPSDSGPAPSLPETAARVSGQTYILAENALSWQSFTLNFHGGEASIRLTFQDSAEWPLSIGLADYQINHIDQFIFPEIPVAARGYWRSDDTFILHLQPLNEIHDLTYTFTFDGVNVQVRADNGIAIRGTLRDF